MFSKLDTEKKLLIENDFLNESKNKSDLLWQNSRKNSVLDLARNIFENVDFDLFPVEFLDDEKIEENHKNESESFYFLEKIKEREKIERNEKKYYEILGYNKKIIKVFINHFIDLFLIFFILKEFDNIENLGKEELKDFASNWGIKGNMSDVEFS